ncbi:unnamed protein product [Caenorhabditis auriculariae]|uniref:Uncharacterized protein n=1 Tax=Caenorhabditis auriculariae TaxID=2777116 RepID=A0A8S1HM31_9PELO|nr:unnamed protein product [Caenorhabditis auriculariae]
MRCWLSLAFHCVSAFHSHAEQERDEFGHTLMRSRSNCITHCNDTLTFSKVLAKQTSPILQMSGNLTTSMDVDETEHSDIRRIQDPKTTLKVSKIEELDTQREEFRKDSESLTLEQLKRKAEMLEDKATKASAKAAFARSYYENEKMLIEKRQAAHQERKKKKDIVKTQRTKLMKLHRAERDRKIKARDEADKLREEGEYY